MKETEKAKKLSGLSKQIITILNEVKENETLLQLLINNETNPFSREVTEEQKKKAFDVSDPDCKLLPIAFSPEATAKDEVFLRVYINSAELKDNGVNLKATLCFDIICAKSLWLIKTETESLIRPWEIASHLISQFDKYDMEGVGIIDFSGTSYLSVSNNYDALRIYAETLTIDVETNLI